MRYPLLILPCVAMMILLGAGCFRRTQSDVAIRVTNSPVTSAQKEDVASGDYTYSFKTNDGERTYLVHVPKGYADIQSAPVLLHLHGGTGTAKSAALSSRFSEMADARGFIAVYGQGTVGLVGKMTSWNAGDCCGASQTKNVDDVGYVREVVKQVISKFRVDPQRIYLSGMSNGGMLVNRIACEAADLFAGAATVAGTIQVDSCVPSKKIPMLIMHGTLDINVPYKGGKSESPLNKGTFISVEQAFKDWGARNGCAEQMTTKSLAPVVNDGTSVDILSFSSCDQPVFLYRVNEGGHSWPGANAGSNTLELSSPSQAINASETIADFFGL